jgi:hypothetical protein
MLEGTVVLCWLEELDVFCWFVATKSEEEAARAYDFGKLVVIIEASIEVDCNCLVMSAFFPASFGRQISKLGEFAF